MSLAKVSYEAFVFSVFSRNQEKTKPLTWWSVSSVPGQHIGASAGPGPTTPPKFKFSKTVEVGSLTRMIVLRLQLCQREIATDEIQEKEIIESAAL